MNPSPQQWLANRASLPGMLACGVRRPDGGQVSHSREDICPTGKVEQLLNQFENLRSALFAGPAAPRWWTWTFEQGQIRFVARPDGWVLGLVARHDSDAIPQLDPLSNEFLSLEFGR